MTKKIRWAKNNVLSRILLALYNIIETNPEVELKSSLDVLGDVLENEIMTESGVEVEIAGAGIMSVRTNRNRSK